MKRRLTVLAALLALVTAGVATYAWAATSDGQVINACVGEDGKLRLAAAETACKKGETALSWNTVGPQGAPGPQGPPGPAGSAVANPDATSAALEITGQKQGSFSSSPIAVIAVSHEIVSPRDPASGLPTGKRMHKPFVITKELDKSSPLLIRALTTNENLTTVVLTYFRQGQAVATVTLTNASAAQYLAHGQDESWSFTYQKITWTWLDGGITAEDDWEAPVAR